MNDNDIVVEAWNTVLFDKFVRFKHLLIAGLAGHSDELFSRGLLPPGARVLDIGCGFGDSTLRIARAVGPSGQAVGVDCAENFIRAGGAGGEGSRHSQCFVSSLPMSRPTICAAPTTMPSRASGPCSSSCRAPRCATSARR